MNHEQPPRRPTPEDIRAEAFSAWLGLIGLKYYNQASELFDQANKGYFGSLREYTLHRLTESGDRDIINSAITSLSREAAPYFHFDIDTYEYRLPIITVHSEFGGVHIFDELSFPQERD